MAKSDRYHSETVDNGCITVEFLVPADFVTLVPASVMFLLVR